MFFFLNGCAYKDDDYLFKVNDFVFTESDFFSRPDFLLAREAGLKKNDAGYKDLIQDVFLETLSVREGFLRDSKSNYALSESAAINWARSNFENNKNLIDFLKRNNLSWVDIVIHFNKRLMYEEIINLYVGVNDFEVKQWCEKNEEVLSFMWTEWRKGTKLSSPENIPETYAHQYCRSALIQHKSSNPIYKEKAIEAISRGLRIEWPNK